MRKLALGAISAMTLGCTNTPAPTPRVPTPRTSPTQTPAAHASASGAPAENAPPTQAGPDEDQPPDPDLKRSAELRAGEPPCTLVFRAQTHEETEHATTFRRVSRIFVEPGGLCTKQLLLDLEARPEGDWESLEGGRLPKPGHQEAAEKSAAEGAGTMLVDVNFDGYLDLAVVAASGSYNSTFRYWVFDAKAGAFSRNQDLERLRWPTFDAAKKRVLAGGRVSGTTYEGGEYAWQDGKLITLSTETSFLGETPQGKPLPRGFARYEIRHKRINGKLQKVFEGPVRSKP